MLRPPVLEVPSQERLMFSNVTVIDPGLDRRDGQILTAQGRQIVSITAKNPNSRDSEATSHFAGA
jgi:hypothetical protein